MALFVVRHQHEAATCPAGDPRMGPALVQHVSPQNAEQFGVHIRGDAVVDGAHTFYLILEAENEGRVQEFMGPFYQAGSVEIMPANTCEAVVTRAKC